MSWEAEESDDKAKEKKKKKIVFFVFFFFFFFWQISFCVKRGVRGLSKKIYPYQREQQAPNQQEGTDTKMKKSRETM
jgi:hypothetical protein